MDAWIDIGLWISYILFFVAIGAAIVLPIIYSLSDPKSLVGVGISVAALLILFFISYVLSSDEITNPKAAANYGVTATGSKTIGGSLIMMYIMFVGAVIGVVVNEVIKFFK
ncbi:MAG: hypothetical protein MUE81_15340 [Thermoflexibacter sp.]|jgi:hypothetical protein|nr:hypothetical protein [Thermoflexibacter sp.]